MRIVLITGISGSGKSVALNVLEDTGHYCVDNLPPALLSHLVTTLTEEGLQALAVAVDARSAESLASLPGDVQRLRAEGHDVKVMFLTANTHSLVARFSETRRSHPLSHELRPGQNPAARRHTDRMHHGRARTAVDDRTAGPCDRHLRAQRQQAARLGQGSGADRACAADAVL